MLLDRFLGGVDQAFGLVAGLDQLLALLVGLGILLGLLDHALDVGLREAAGRLDGDPLLLVGALVAGRDVDDAVGVDVEGDIDLRQAARRRGDVLEVELAQHLVVRRHLALALVDPDRHRRLVVFRRREHLRLLGRDGGVAVDQPGEDAAQGLDAETERSDVEQHHVLDVALQHAGLDRGAQRHHLVRVDAAMGLLAEEGLHLLEHPGHAGHAADQDHLVDVRSRDAGILERVLAGLDGALD